MRVKNNCLAKLAFSFFGILVLDARAVLSDASREFYSTQAMERFVRLPQNARILGTAGSIIQTTYDSSSILGNPAGLGRMHSDELSISGGQRTFESEEFHNDNDFELFENAFQAYLAVPIGENTTLGSKYGTIAAGYSRFSGSSSDSIGTSPDGHLRTLAYSIAPLDTISIGYSFSFIEDQLHSNIYDYHSHARFMHLLGTQILVSEDLSIGSTFGWLISQTDSEEFSVDSNGLTKNRQYSFSCGGDYSVLLGKISAALDFNYYRSKGELDIQSPLVIIGNSEEGETVGGRIGIEQKVLPWLTVRGGYRYTDILEYEFKAKNLERLSGRFNYSAFAAGVGLHLPKGFQLGNPDAMRLDYGIEYRDISDDEMLQMLTLTAVF